MHLTVEDLITQQRERLSDSNLKWQNTFRKSIHYVLMHYVLNRAVYTVSAECTQCIVVSCDIWGITQMI